MSLNSKPGSKKLSFRPLTEKSLRPPSRTIGQYQTGHGYHCPFWDQTSIFHVGQAARPHENMTQTINNARPAAARAFVRSLNILLKFARMYDFGHPRTAKQYETAWSELRTALGSG